MNIVSTAFMVAALCVLSATAHSASFDCSKTNSIPEYLICNTPELSKADDELKVSFEAARERAPDKAAFAKAATAQWNLREKSCRDVACLQGWYADQKAIYAAATPTSVSSDSTDSVASTKAVAARPGTVGYLMLRNAQDLLTQCSNPNMAHSEKSWCYDALLAYADSAAFLSFFSGPKVDFDDAKKQYDGWLAQQKKSCEAGNSGGNWSDIHIAACEVNADLKVMGAVNQPTRSNPSASSSQSVRTTPDAPTAMNVTAADLFREYHANEVAADLRFKGKRISIQGIVAEIGVDFSGNPYVNLAAPGDSFYSVHLTFPKSATGRLAQLSKGTPVSVECTGSGMTIGSPTLDCR